MKPFFVVLSLLLLAFIAGTRLNAQDYVYQTGSPTFSTQIPIENGFINVNNGEIHIEIPLATQPQRGDLSPGFRT